MLWVKSFHIFFVICWYAGIFYLPRLFVYHSMSDDQVGIERFKIMERKLYNGIMMPNMILAWLFGAWLISYNPDYYLQAGWLHAKLTLVVLITIYHFYLGKLLKDFKHDRNRHSHVFYRILNELPVLALIAILILVVVKPF